MTRLLVEGGVGVHQGKAPSLVEARGARSD